MESLKKDREQPHKKLKILVFVDTFMYPTLSFIYNEILRVNKTHHVKIVCTSRSYADQFPFDDVEVIPFVESALEQKLNHYLSKYKLLFMKRSSVFSKKLDSLLMEYDPDIIHGHFGNESVRIFDNIKKNKYINFISFHGYDASMMLSNSAYVRKLNSYFSKENFYSIHVSHFMKNELGQKGVNTKQSFLNYYGVNTEFYDPDIVTINNNDDHFVFLQIAALREKKGHIYTLKAFAGFLESVQFDKKYKLILAGDGELRMELEKLAQELKITDHVIFKGLVNYEQCRKLLQEANVFVHHSITSRYGDREGVPNAIIEAMAMKLPVLATYHAGIPELVEDGKNGYLVEEKDIEGYIESMKKIVLWGKLDDNRQKVLKQFSIEVHTKKLLGFYEQALNQK